MSQHLSYKKSSAFRSVVKSVQKFWLQDSNNYAVIKSGIFYDHGRYRISIPFPIHSLILLYCGNFLEDTNIRNNMRLIASQPLVKNRRPCQNMPLKVTVHDLETTDFVHKTCEGLTTPLIGLTHSWILIGLNYAKQRLLIWRVVSEVQAIPLLWKLNIWPVILV